MTINNKSRQSMYLQERSLTWSRECLKKSYHMIDLQERSLDLRMMPIDFIYHITTFFIYLHRYYQISIVLELQMKTPYNIPKDQKHLNITSTAYNI